MKKLLNKLTASLLSVLMVVSMMMTGGISSVSATNSSTDYVYYGFKEVTRDASTNTFELLNGHQYLLAEGTYNESSALFNLEPNDAIVEINTSLSGGKYNDSYMNSIELTKYVDVIKSGSAFDSCRQGTISYGKAKGNVGQAQVAENTEGWYYSCLWGGCQFAGVYKLYDFQKAPINANNVNSERANDFSWPATTLDATTSMLNTTVQIGGREYTLTGYDFASSNNKLGGNDHIVDIKVGNVVKTVFIRGQEQSVTFTDEDVTTTAEDGTAKVSVTADMQYSTTDPTGKGLNVQWIDCVTASNYSNGQLTLEANKTYYFRNKVKYVSDYLSDASKDAKAAKNDGLVVNSDIYNDASTVTSLYIKKYQAPDFASLVGEAPSTKDGTDGHITGETSGKNYEVKVSGTWTDLTATTDLDDGLYEVRLKSDDDDSESSVGKVYVPNNPGKVEGLTVAYATNDTNTLTGFTSAMELSVDGTNWYDTATEGKTLANAKAASVIKDYTSSTITLDSTKTYQVRYKEVKQTIDSVEYVTAITTKDADKYIISSANYEVSTSSADGITGLTATTKVYTDAACTTEASKDSGTGVYAKGYYYIQDKASNDNGQIYKVYVPEANTTDKVSGLLIEYSCDQAKKVTLRNLTTAMEFGRVVEGADVTYYQVNETSLDEAKTDEIITGYKLEADGTYSVVFKERDTGEKYNIRYAKTVENGFTTKEAGTVHQITLDNEINGVTTDSSNYKEAQGTLKGLTKNMIYRKVGETYWQAYNTSTWEKENAVSPTNLDKYDIKNVVAGAYELRYGTVSASNEVTDKIEVTFDAAEPTLKDYVLYDNSRTITVAQNLPAVGALPATVENGQGKIYGLTRDMYIRAKGATEWTPVTSYSGADNSLLANPGTYEVSYSNKANQTSSSITEVKVGEAGDYLIKIGAAKTAANLEEGKFYVRTTNTDATKFANKTYLNSLPENSEIVFSGSKKYYGASGLSSAASGTVYYYEVELEAVDFSEDGDAKAVVTWSANEDRPTITTEVTQSKIKVEVEVTDASGNKTKTEIADAGYSINASNNTIAIPTDDKIDLTIGGKTFTNVTVDPYTTTKQANTNVPACTKEDSTSYSGYGKIKGLNASTMEMSTDSTFTDASKTVAITGTEMTVAQGTYYIRYKETDLLNASDNQTLVVSHQLADNTTTAEQIKAMIDTRPAQVRGGNGTIIYLTSALEVSKTGDFSDSSSYVPTNGTLSVAPGKYYVREKATDRVNASVAAEVYVQNFVAESQKANIDPTVVVATAPATVDGTTGTITGLDATTMEMSTDRTFADETKAIAITGSTMTLEAGKTYYVRNKGDAVDDPGNALALTIHKHIEAHREDNVVAATCSQAGSYDYATYCSECNKIFSTEHKTGAAALGHVWSAWSVTTEPTYTEDGVKARTCSRCNEVETESIPATGLTYDSNYTYDNEYHWYQCVTPGYTDRFTGKQAHNWGTGVVTKAPTCSAKGVMTYTCGDCGATKTEEIAKDASNHTGRTVVKNAKAATCSATGYTGDTYCADCDAKLASGTVIAKTAHTPVADAYVAATGSTTGLTAGSHCSRCGTTLVAQQTIAVIPNAVGYSYALSNTENVTILTNTADSKTVSYKNKQNTVKYQTIGSTVTLNGETFTVTALKRDAVNGSYVKTLILANTISSLEAGAFNGDNKLTKLYIKSATMNVASTAFTGMKKAARRKLKVYVSKKMSKKAFNALKKKLVKQGLKASNIIRK